jgi:hypothetical protein
MLEKFLTRTPEQFAQLYKDGPPLDEPPKKETYRYSKVCFSSAAMRLGRLSVHVLE